MLECVSFKSLTPSPTNLPPLPPPPPPPHSEGNSTVDTPATSPNVSREFDRAVQAHSYNEIRTMVQAPPQAHELEVEEEDEDSHHRHVLSQVLQPDSNSVKEALAKSTPNSTLTRLVSTYFDHSETASDFCLRLSRSIHRSRDLYAPLSAFLSVLPSTDSLSLSQPQCHHAYDLFLQFDAQENPFTLSQLHQLRLSFSDLKRDIQRDLRRRHSRIRLRRHTTAGCALCLIAATAAAVVTATFVAVHAAVGFTAVAAAPFCNPRKSVRKERARLKQLEAVENGTLVVNDINTIDSLVDRIQTAVEGDKAHVRFALERGRERHPIQEVLKQLRKNQPVLEQLLRDLEQHIYFCFYTVNKARHALLKEICLHQTL